MEAGLVKIEPCQAQTLFPIEALPRLTQTVFLEIVFKNIKLKFLSVSDTASAWIPYDLFQYPH